MTIRYTPLKVQYKMIFQQEIVKLLNKKVIETILQGLQNQRFYSMYFLVLKRTGDWGPVLDFCPLNQRICVE